MELTIDKAFKKAIEAHQAGQLEDAERLYRAILQAKPQHPDANHNLGVLAISLNKPELALPLFKTALQANANQGQYWISYIDALIKTNQLESAKSMLEQGKKRGLIGEKVDALSRQLIPQINQLDNQGPSKEETKALLEIFQFGQYDVARKLASEMTKKYPEHLFGWNMLGTIFKASGKLHDAVIATQKAVALEPNDAVAHYNLGNILKELGKLADAECSYRQAITLKPGFAEAYYNLGNTLNELGKLADAEASYRQAIALKPEYAVAHMNLGNVLKDFGRLQEAKLSYAQSVALNPNLAEAYMNLGITLKELGQDIEALDAAIKSIKIKPTAQTKSFFVEATKNIDFRAWDYPLAELVTTALLEPWDRPSELQSAAGKLLKTDKEFTQHLNQPRDLDSQADLDQNLISSIAKKEFVSNSLLCAMLTSSPIPDPEIEAFLTRLRRNLLKDAVSNIRHENTINDVGALYCSLAQQCFINEYVYYQTPQEIEDSNQLLNQLTQALKDGQNIPAALVITVACYFPLYSVKGAEKLLHQDWPVDVKRVLKQQIQEPLEELNLQVSIVSLTSIDNPVSLAVQSQYEENPYPRWVRLPIDSSKKCLNAQTKSKFPLSAFKRLENDAHPEILIAGCGTGQHPIGKSQLIQGANILAVDLSMASLAYAKRKTAELGITNIEYAQADLLKLGALDKTFDVIESSGVLHHLENPFVGWEVLLSLLKPCGLMRLGFYSELARQDIVRVRKLISAANIVASPQGIRDYRKYLLHSNAAEDYGFATSSSDFFSTSACRDLLFHVQEHRMTLPVLAKFLTEHNLTFLGFDIDSSVKHAYKNHFPDDPSATNLNNWHTFEEENPDTFVGMYQFWCQKKS